MLQESIVSFTFAYLFIYLKYKIERKNLLSFQISRQILFVNQLCGYWNSDYSHSFC